MDPSSKNYRDSGVPSDLEKAAGSERDRKISAESTACGGSKEGSMSAGSVEEAANSTRENGEGAGTKEEPTSSGPLDWDGPDDPANPFNWSSGKRWFGTIVPGCLCTLVTIGSSVYVPGTFEVAREFGVSIQVALLGLSMYVIGLGLGPMMSAPLSEVFGRKIVYLVNLPIYLLFTMGAGLAKNIETLIICRLFAGVFGGPALTVSAGSFVDIWELKTSGLAVTVQALATFLGPALGPIVGGYLAQYQGWRWTMWIVLIIAGALAVPLLIMEETYKPVILKKRTLQRGLLLPPSPPPKDALKLIFTITLARPIQMLILEPIVQAVAVYSSFAFAVLFGFFAAFPFTFQREHGFTLGESGLAFIGIAVGLFVGCAIYLLQDKLIYMPALARTNGHAEPELRLVPAMIGSFLMPIGLFWFAWTADRDIHWISPILAGVPFAAGLVLVFLTSVMYLLEIYPPFVAASAMTALAILRYLMAMAFPLFTITMFENLGIAWATSVFGFISLALMPIPWVFKRWGPKIRAMSKFEAITDY